MGDVAVRQQGRGPSDGKTLISIMTGKWFMNRGPGGPSPAMSRIHRH